MRQSFNVMKNPGILQGLNEHQCRTLGYQGVEIRKAVDHVTLGFFRCVSPDQKPKKKPRHITKVSTTFMLFHMGLLWAAGGKQSLIFINKTLQVGF
jgi:hypothetical protein